MIEGVQSSPEIRSLGQIFTFELPVSQEGLDFLRSENIQFNPELQLRFIQMVEFERGGKYLERTDLEHLKSRIDEIRTEDAKQQELIATQLPPGSPSREDIVLSIEVVHMPTTSDMVGSRRKVNGGACFRVRAMTKEGFLVPLRKVPSPQNTRLDRKRSEIEKRFEQMIGRSISFSSKQSAKGRYFLTVSNASLPENLQRDK